MNIKPFANHAQALALRAERNEVLASNIANTDTPGYKARDFDFRAAMQAQTGTSMKMATTHRQHMDVNGNLPDTRTALAYRIPTQPSVDGNTVEADIEQAAYAENVVGYQASLSFLNRKIAGLQLAIRGGS